MFEENDSFYKDIDDISIFDNNAFNNEFNHEDIHENFDLYPSRKTTEDYLGGLIPELENLSFIENTDSKILNLPDEIYLSPSEEKLNNSTRKKRKKEDLDKTPLPLFDCIYCSNEKVVFQHMVRENISKEYLYMCSKYDSIKINYILSNPLSINYDNVSNYNSNNLMNMIIYYTENLNTYYNSNQSLQLLKKITYSKYYKPEINKSLPVLKHRFCTFENTITLLKTACKILS